MKEPVITTEHIFEGNSSEVILKLNTNKWILSGPWHLDEDEKKKKNIIDFGSVTLNFNHQIQIESNTYLIHPDDIVMLTDFVDKLKKGGSGDYHIRLITGSGEIQLLHGFGKFERNASLTNGTESDSRVDPANHYVKSLEKRFTQLTAQKELLQKCLDGMPHLVWLGDSKGNFLLFNDRWLAYTGLSIESSSGYKYIKSGLIHPSQIKEVTTKWENSLKHGIPYSNETLLRNAQGEYHWHLDTIFPLTNDQGKIDLWVGTLIDVNEEFVAEKKIQENNHLLEAIFNSSLNGIQVFESIRDDNTNKIIDFEWKYHNKIAREIFDKGDLTDKSLTKEYPRAVSSGLVPKFKDVTLKGEPVQFEHYFTSGDIEKWFEISAVKLEDGVVATFHDISLRKQAEFELKDSRHFIQHIANSTPDIIYVIDLSEGKIIYANGKVKDYLGLEAEELYRLGPGVFQALMHPDDNERRMHQIKSLVTLKDNETRDIEVRLRTAEGNYRWFKIRDTLFKRHPDGSVWQTIGLVQDIHDLKTAQDEINIQHQVDRQAEKIAQIGNWHWNITSGELTWGDNLFNLLGLQPGKVQPSIKTFINALYPEDRAYFIHETQKVKRAGNTGIPKLFYFRVQREDGSIRHLRAATELISLHGEKRMIGTVRDVTQEVINESEIRDRINFIETLVESSTQRIAVVDRNYRYLVWNKRCEEVYGLSKAEVLGKTIREVYPRIDENAVWFGRIESAFKGEILHFPEEKSARTDNYYEGFYIPLKNDRQEIYAVLNILHDVTDKVHSKMELQNLNESLQHKNFELRMMNEQLSTFAFVASHDLREPLRKIQVFSNSIQQSKENHLSPKGKEYFDKILSSIERMNQLIEDILSFSRIHANPKDFVRVDLNEIVDTIKSDLQEVIQEKGVIIECNSLPSYSGNRSQLFQLFQNLLTNAIKFQEPGNKPVIFIKGEIVSGSEIAHPSARKKKHYLKVEVRDNGIGFEEQYYNKIFQMFQRLHGISQYSGTGMGLAICKKIAENHEGFIDVRSIPGQGSSFTCYLLASDQESV